MTTATLLVELLSEELPPKALERLSDAFASGIMNGLRTRLFLSEDSAATAYATPRRLAVSITQVLAQSPDRPLVEKLMPVSIAFDDADRPTAALKKRLAKLGREALADRWPDARDGPDEIFREGEGKTATVFLRTVAGGKRLGLGLQSALDDTLASLPVPKLMSYQIAAGTPEEKTVQFARPAHRLVALHGSDVVAVTALGLVAGHETAGHRFIGQAFLNIKRADDYAAALRDEGKVVASFSERRDAIHAALLRAAGDDAVIMPDALLAEVTALVEWPVIYAGSFDSAFLDVPQECLILTMQQNQKYFALTDASGKMRNRFLLVSNLETEDPSAIIGGNERVLSARLADAKFFYDQDRKKPLASRLAKLANVTYRDGLGTQYERVERLALIAGDLAADLGADVELARRAARLAKADLTTDMVGEFPELQGIMGRYYAIHDGEPAQVCDAIAEHYRPRFAGDELPPSPISNCVALADKLEAIVGLFSIDQVPTGDKDPFALRRSALGVLRILIERKLPMHLDAMIQTALDAMESDAPRKAWAKVAAEEATQRTRASEGVRGFGFGGATRRVPDATSTQVLQFLYDRLRGLLREQGYNSDEIEAVVSQSPRRIDQVLPRMEAVRAFATLPEAESLAAANKRVGNILKNSDLHPTAGFEYGKLKEQAERDLADALASVVSRSDAYYNSNDYSASLRTLAELKVLVDSFFESVLVNTDNPALRKNRLGLLAALQVEMNRVADISKLAT